MIRVELEFDSQKEAEQALSELSYLLTENAETDRNIEADCSVSALEKFYNQLESKII